MSFRIRTKDEALNEIKELVCKFERNSKTYLGIDYNEANTRLEFIDKFFEAFNWDVRNENGFADKYKDVKVETTNEKEKKNAQNIVDALDKEINTKVYELYGLSEEEIAEVEK